MTRGIIWLAAAGLFALATHLAYVLFLPRYEMSRLMEEAASIVGINTFAVLEKSQQEAILKASSRTGVAGVCPFDLKDGALVFDAMLPDGIWSFSIYSEDGRDAYAIDEAQAGTNRFRLTLKQSPGLIGMLLGEGSDGAAVSEGWTAAMPSRRGLAILWVALEDRALRPAYADVLKQSTCRIERQS